MPIKGTYYKATLGAAPTTSSQLGGYISGTFITGVTPGNIYSMSLTPGSWIIVGNANFPSATSGTLSISETSNTNNYNSYVSIPVSGTIAINITRCVNITSSTTYYLIGTSGNNITLTLTTFYAFRIG